MDVPFDLWGQRGGPGIDVIGEPQYAAPIRDVLGTSFRPGGSELMVTARLVPEPWNQDAVAIRVGERQVGYLPPHEAVRYAPVLSRLVAAGWSPQVAARVRAVSDHRGLTASVWVDLAAPHLIAPVNRPPEGSCRLLPPGVAIPVIVDENLLPRPGGEGDCWVCVTLHELVEALPRGSRSVLQVRLDGAVVGRLTPRMSAELLPAVRRLAGNHQLTAARGLLKSSGPAPELVVYAARSHELPELWLDSIAAPAPAASGRLLIRSSAATTTAAADRPIGAARPSATAAPLGIAPPGGSPAPLYISPADVTSTSLYGTPSAGLYGSPSAARSESLHGSPSAARSEILHGSPAAARPEILHGSPAAAQPEALHGSSFENQPGVRHGSPAASTSTQLGMAPPASPPGPIYGSPPARPARDEGRAADSGGHWGLVDAGKPAAGFERSRTASGGHINALADPPENPGPRPEESPDGRRRLVPAPRDAGSAGPAAPLPPGQAGPSPLGPAAPPPPPAGVRFVAPPGWPAPPSGWTPPTGWHPNPAWPPAPADWQWWVPYWE